jgi:hypothetical protein
MLKAVEVLCDDKEGVNIFNRMFKLISAVKTDEEMQENIINLVHMMIDHGDTQNVI